jgi:hypothetical protein
MKPIDLLDKNQRPHQKKIAAAPKELIQEILSMSDAPDIKSAINAAIHGITKMPTCPECGGKIGVDHRGIRTKLYCSLKCLNTSSSIAEKIRLKKLADSPEKKAQIQAKRKQTCMEKYGVDHVLKIPGIAAETVERGNEKRKATMQRKASDHLVAKGYLPQQAAWSEETRRKIKDSELLRDLFFEKLLPVNEIAERIGCSPSTVTNRLADRGWERKDQVLSRGENEIYELLSKHCTGITINRNDRKVFSNKFELDLYLPEKRLAIEYHGLYWHSLDLEGNSLKENRLRHQKKALECEPKGIKLIQIFEDEWRDRRAQCEGLILNALNLSEKMGAREFKISIIPGQIATTFFNRNHMAGFSPATHYIGLSSKSTGDLMSCMSFSKVRFPRRGKEDLWEIVRFASSRGFNIVGAGSKLIAEFQRIEPIARLTTYADLRFGTGASYLKMGFVEDGITSPGYSWVIGRNRLSRYSVKKRIPGYDPSKTEDTNLFLGSGARKLYDAGSRRFVLPSRG